MADQAPLEPGYFRLPASEGERGRLLGSYSAAADKYFFPQRLQCPITEEPVEEVELSPEGTLYSWTWVSMPFMGNMQMGDGKGHAVGQIDLPEGVRIQSVIQGQRDDFEIGMRMGLAFVPVKKKGNRQLMTFCFAPIKEESK